MQFDRCLVLLKQFIVQLLLLMMVLVDVVYARICFVQFAEDELVVPIEDLLRCNLCSN